MEKKNKRQQPPIWLFLIIFFALFLLISLGVTLLFQLPWYFSIPNILGVVVGVILLVLGFYILISALKALKLSRAFGKDIYKTKTESKLITTGIYAFTRNPVYFGSILLFLGWFFIFLFTFLLIMTILFTILFYLVAKWEEKELLERFGDEYRKYKKIVPFFIPYPKKRPKIKK